MRILLPLIFASSLLLGACVTRPSETSSLKQHDLGLPLEAGSAKSALALRRVEVIASPVLAGQAMQYRYAEDQTTRRLGYADSRWSASPPLLVEAQLSRMLVGNAASSRCKLSVRLDEFVQIFARDGSSVAYSAGSFRLLADRADEVIAQRPFELRQAAAGADAAAGAQALRGVTSTMAQEAANWLNTIDARRCSAG